MQFIHCWVCFFLRIVLRLLLVFSIVLFVLLSSSQRLPPQFAFLFHCLIGILSHEHIVAVALFNSDRKISSGNYLPFSKTQWRLIPNEWWKDINLESNKRISSSAPEIAAKRLKKRILFGCLVSFFFCSGFVCLSHFLFHLLLLFSSVFFPSQCALFSNAVPFSKKMWKLVFGTTNQTMQMEYFNYILLLLVVFFKCWLNGFLFKRWKSNPHFSIWILSCENLQRIICCQCYRI